MRNRSSEIPPFIKKINSFAFLECDSLYYIKFPENLEPEIIGKNAFELIIISRISIPKPAKIIGESSFAQCTNLEKIVIDRNSELPKIGKKKNAFNGTVINYLYIPSGLKEPESGWCD